MNKFHSLALIATLTATAGLCAQTSSDAPRGPHRGHGRGPGNPVVRVLDADRDGTVSASELANAPTALKALDTDGDGAVSAAELHPGRPANAPAASSDTARPARPADPVMLALDADGDGALSAAEIANATASLKALDSSGDGQLTRDELRPLPPTKE